MDLNGRSRARPQSASRVRVAPAQQPGLSRTASTGALRRKVAAATTADTMRGGRVNSSGGTVASTATRSSLLRERVSIVTRYRSFQYRAERGKAPSSSPSQAVLQSEYEGQPDALDRAVGDRQAVGGIVRPSSAQRRYSSSIRQTAPTYAWSPDANSRAAPRSRPSSATGIRRPSYVVQEQPQPQLAVASMEAELAASQAAAAASGDAGSEGTSIVGAIHGRMLRPRRPSSRAATTGTPATPVDESAPPLTPPTPPSMSNPSSPVDASIPARRPSKVAVGQNSPRGSPRTEALARAAEAGRTESASSNDSVRQGLSDSVPNTANGEPATSSSTSPDPTAQPKNSGEAFDAGIACQSLPLYDAFAFDPEVRLWTVQEDVRNRVLDFVRSMNYPGLALWEVRQRRAAKNHSFAAAAAGSTSQSTSRFASPASSVAASPKSSVASPTYSTSSVRADARAAEQHLPLPAEEALRWVAEQEYFIGAVLLCCSYVVQKNLSSPTAEDPATTKQASRSSSAATSPVQPSPTQEPAFAESHKSLLQTMHRNIMALDNSLTSPTDSSAPQQPVRPLIAKRQSIPPDVHPVRYVTNYVLNTFPQWGSFEAFAAAWAAQARVVTEIANPKNQIKVLRPAPTSSIVFTSDMECGNLSSAKQAAINGSMVYLLWVEGDCDTDKKLWFRFGIKGAHEREPLCIRMMNLSPHGRLYRNGMRPVWRAGLSQPTWRPVDEMSYTLSDDESEGVLSFYIVPRGSGETINVSFCVPYGYSDLLCHVSRWHALVKSSTASIRFEERVLCRTLDGRKLHLLIITSQGDSVKKRSETARRSRPLIRGGRSGKGFQTPVAGFEGGKKVILVSGRVHPGEVSASHAVHGLITFLLSDDERAAMLRDHFIFFIVPMLNPDGVARGHTRLDQRGVNLNRCYVNPKPNAHPTVHALKNVFDHLQTNFGERLIMYLDFHSHASQTNGFTYGNNLNSGVQHWNTLFSKLISLHSPHYSHNLSRFGKNDMSSKEGTSRVLFGTTLVHSYTIELTHFTDGTLEDEGCAMANSADVGRACLLALLDVCQVQESSPLNKAGGLEALTREMKQALLNMPSKKRTPVVSEAW